MIKTYSELIKLQTFEERFKYLKLDGRVGVDTFGFDRFLNQTFYKSHEWKKTRDYIIIRDNACDLGVENHDIFGKIIIHHINPITQDDLYNQTDLLLNPEFLISTSLRTHNAIHYSDETILDNVLIERIKNDTTLW